MKAIWAVACTVLAVTGLITIGSGCGSVGSDIKEFSRMDVGEGPGGTMVRLTEMQKTAESSPRNPPASSTRSPEPAPVRKPPASPARPPKSAPVTTPQKRITAEPVIRTAPTGVSSPSPRVAKGPESPPVSPPKKSEPPPPMVSMPEIKKESQPTTPVISPAPNSPRRIPPRNRASGAADNYRLGPEDIIHISVWGNTELTMDVVVRPDGQISIPLVQDIQAEGLTAGELADDLQQRLVAYIKDPNVSVIVKEVNASKFYIVGYVTKPGTYPLRGDVSVLQALSLAGGFTQFASPRKIRLVRKNGKRQEVRVVNYYDMIDKDGEGNYFLKPGDTIVVP